MWALSKGCVGVVTDYADTEFNFEGLSPTLKEQSSNIHLKLGAYPRLKFTQLSSFEIEYLLENVP